MSSRPATVDPWRPTSSASARRQRAALYQCIRAFFAQRQVLEVETPLWSACGNPDPNIDSVAAAGGFLRTSPEFAMKRLLAADSGPIYELGRVLRAGEAGAQHNPEFTMLEWYRPEFDYHQLMLEVVELVQAAASLSSQSVNVEKISFAQATLQRCGIDSLAASDEELNTLVQQRGWYDGATSRNESLDLVLSLGLAASWPADQLTVIYDFPASQAALARLHPADRRTAMRFEVYWGSVELANGYDELLDAALLSERFEAENAVRQPAGKPAMPVDQRLLAAVESGIPPTAGVALGIDRLLMCMSNSRCIDEVLNFPMSRA